MPQNRTVKGGLVAPNLERTNLLQFGQVHDSLRRDRVPAEQRLCHRIDLVIVSTIGECRALFDEVVDPWRVVRVWQVHVAGFDQGLTAAARATFPPSGLTGRRPGSSRL